MYKGSPIHGTQTGYVMVELISLENTSHLLVESFNARRGLVRVLAFVSPT